MPTNLSMNCNVMDHLGGDRHCCSWENCWRRCHCGHCGRATNEVLESRTRQTEAACAYVNTGADSTYSTTGSGLPVFHNVWRSLQNGCRDEHVGQEEALRSRKHSTVSAGASWWTGTVPESQRSSCRGPSGWRSALLQLGRLLTPLFLWSETSCCTRTGMSTTLSQICNYGISASICTVRIMATCRCTTMAKSTTLSKICTC